MGRQKPWGRQPSNKRQRLEPNSLEIRMNPNSRRVEFNRSKPPVKVKRKRGRPRKDSYPHYGRPRAPPVPVVLPKPSRLDILAAVASEIMTHRSPPTPPGMSGGRRSRSLSPRTPPRLERGSEVNPPEKSGT